MEFKQSPIANRRNSASSSHPSTKPTSRRPNTPPTVRQALRSSSRMIKVAVSHAVQATTKEAKYLFKITEEEFGLDEHPRWQKARSQIRAVLRRLRLPKWLRKVYVLISCVLIVGLVSMFIYQRLTSTPSQNKESKSFTSGKLEKGTPTYSTLLPDGKTIESLGGWTRVSPGTTNPVYAFSDKVEGVPIIVSEQPLPDPLAKPGALEEFAKSYSADHKVTVEGVTVFIGTSGKGPQSAVLAKNNLLILIKTDSKLTDTQWANYVGSLK